LLARMLMSPCGTPGTKWMPCPTVHRIASYPQPSLPRNRVGPRLFTERRAGTPHSAHYGRPALLRQARLDSPESGRCF
jgi:hypothetical protein